MSGVQDGASVGELLKTARQRNRLTLRELAEDPEIGVSATFLSRVERNDSLPSDELLVKLSRRLGLDATTALLRLFRERASPEVREFVPLPSVMKLQGSSAPIEGGGLERIAEPIAQILDMHRELLAENAQLKEERAQQERELMLRSAEAAESKRQFLPDVNRFLTSLFNYEIEIVKRDLRMTRTGDATVTMTVEGVMPKRGARPIHSLSHQVFLPQAADGSLNIAGDSALVEIIDKPSTLKVEHSFERESPERGTLVVSFPDGFEWSPNCGRLSYSFSYRLRDAFVMTLEEAKAVYGRRTVHDSPLEWSACFINKPCRRLEMSVSFPEGYSPSYIDRWVWMTDHSFLGADYNLAERLLLDPSDGIEIEEGDHTVVQLKVANPLLGFSYGLVWQPLAKRQFLRLIRD